MIGKLIDCGHTGSDYSRQGTKKFAEAAHQAVAHDAILSVSVMALMEALAAIDGQLARLDDRLKELARRSPVCWRVPHPGKPPHILDRCH